MRGQIEIILKKSLRDQMHLALLVLYNITHGCKDIMRIVRLYYACMLGDEFVFIRLLFRLSADHTGMNIEYLNILLY